MNQSSEATTSAALKSSCSEISEKCLGKNPHWSAILAMFDIVD